MHKNAKMLSEKLRAKLPDFCARPSHNTPERDGGGKKGKLLCCKRIFGWIKGSLAEIQPKNHQYVQKTHFLQKGPGVNGLIIVDFTIINCNIHDY